MSNINNVQAPTTKIVAEEKIFTTEELMNIKDDGVLWLVENLVPKVGLSGITGASDCGKSTIMRHMGISIAAGYNDFLGLSIDAVHKSIIYVCTEDTPPSTKMVVTTQLQAMEVDTKVAIRWVFDTENVITILNKMLIDQKADAVIIDGWADTFHGNPNNLVDIRKNLNSYHRLALKHECAVIMLLHNSKRSEQFSPHKDNLCGSQAMEAKLRSLFELRMGSNPDERILTIVKGNNVAQQVKETQMVLKLDGETRLFTNTGTTKALKGGPGNKGKQYDKELWISRMAEERKGGVSFETGVASLKLKYPDEDVPGTTWFKQHCKDGQTISKVNDRPTELSDIDGKSTQAA